MSRHFDLKLDDRSIGRFSIVEDEDAEGAKIQRLVSLGAIGSREAIHTIMERISVLYPKFKKENL